MSREDSDLEDFGLTVVALAVLLFVATLALFLAVGRIEELLQERNRK